MTDRCEDASGLQRVALLRAGIVVLEARVDVANPYVTVSAPPRADAAPMVRDAFGDGVEVDVVGHLPREHRALPCIGHREREAGRLQLRFVLREQEHVDEIVVVEDDRTIVVLATACTPVAGARDASVDVPCHVHLDRPQGDRVVIDGHRGAPVPYRNVYEEDGVIVDAAGDGAGSPAERVT